MKIIVNGEPRDVPPNTSVAELLVGLARVAGAALGLDDGKDLAARLVQTIVGDAVPGLGVVAIDRDFAADLGLVVQTPLGVPQLRVDQSDARQGFVQVHDTTVYHGTRVLSAIR